MIIVSQRGRDAHLYEWNGADYKYGFIMVFKRIFRAMTHPNGKNAAQTASTTLGSYYTTHFVSYYSAIHDTYT